MTTNKAAAVVSEEQVERMAKWMCRHDIPVSKELDEVLRRMEKWERYKDEAREALNYTLQAALGVGGWRPIAEAPEVKGDYFFCRLAWGPDEDKSTGDGFRFEGEWFAASVFYRMSEHRKFQFKEHKVRPTHFMEHAPPPASEEG